MNSEQEYAHNGIIYNDSTNEVYKTLENVDGTLDFVKDDIYQMNKYTFRKVTLADVLAPKGYIRGPFGSALKRNELATSGIPVYEQQHAIYGIREFRFYINEDKFQEMRRFATLTDDLIISCSGTLGMVSIINEKDPNGIISQALLLLRVNREVIMPQYLKYFFSSSEGLNSIVSRSSGSVQINISKRSVIEQISFNLPPLHLQREIVKMLTSLDDKIELNNRMNKTLEEMAKVIFKSWFVDFEPFQDGEFVECVLGKIPKGWRVGTLDEVTSKFATGLNPRKNFVLGEGNNYYVTIKNMGENQVWLNDRCDKVTDEALYKINRRSDLRMGDLLFSGIGTIGRVCLLNDPPKNWNISESIFTLRSNDILSAEIIYQLLLFEDMQQYAKRLSSGSVQKGIRMADLKKFKIAIPPKAVVDKSTQVFIELNRQVYNFHKQNNNLKSLRDNLLPKLMSGEIRVPVQED